MKKEKYEIVTRQGSNVHRFYCHELMTLDDVIEKYEWLIKALSEYGEPCSGTIEVIYEDA